MIESSCTHEHRNKEQRFQPPLREELIKPWITPSADSQQLILWFVIVDAASWKPFRSWNHWSRLRLDAALRCHLRVKQT